MRDKEVIRLIQTELNKRYHLSLSVDGIAGTHTMNALMRVELLPTDWQKSRKLVGFIQYLCLLEGINAGAIDGYWGPQTDYGYSLLKPKLETGTIPAPWREDDTGHLASPIGTWPRQTTDDLMAFYGDVGTNQTKVKVPYPLRIAWNKSQVIRRFSCHEQVAESIGRVLDRVLDHYGDQIKPLGLDLWGGCLNVRQMRGGTTYSTHSWGIAIDWDPERNQLRWNRDRANFARPEYETWWQLWEAEGWVSLGREKDYDWMHVQAARVR